MKTGMKLEHKWTFTAHPANGMSLDDLETKLRALGHHTLRREAGGIVVCEETRMQLFTTEN